MFCEVEYRDIVEYPDIGEWRAENLDIGDIEGVSVEKEEREEIRGWEMLLIYYIECFTIQCDTMV